MQVKRGVLVSNIVPAAPWSGVIKAGNFNFLLLIWNNLHLFLILACTPHNRSVTSTASGILGTTNSLSRISGVPDAKKFR